MKLIVDSASSQQTVARTVLSPVFGHRVAANQAGQTIDGTEEPDTLTGGALDDSITGRGGADTVTGGAGNDTLSGGDGNDVLDGEDGNDSVDGGLGDDNIEGRDGNDSIAGGAGLDFIIGGNGDDTLSGGDGNDRLNDRSGSNMLDGDAGDDMLLTMGTGASTLDGGIGNDTITSAGANDTIIGGAGRDLVKIEGQYNTRASIHANLGEDNDVLQMMSYDADVTVTGGTGIDTYRMAATGPSPTDYFASHLVVTDFTPGAGGDILDVLRLNMFSYTYNPFGPEGRLRLVQQGADTLLQFDPDGAANSAYGFSTIVVLKNVDASSITADNFASNFHPDGSSPGLNLTGTAGSDTLGGGTEDDTISGGAGDDTLEGYAGDDSISGGDDDDFARGASGNDSIRGGAGNDSVIGGSGDDQLSGEDGDDYLTDDGGTTNTLDGGIGNDILETYGGGKNMLTGGAGHDTLVGGFGQDTLMGGTGNDRIEYTFSQGRLPGAMTANGGDGDDTFFMILMNSLASARVTGGTGIDTYDLAIQYALVPHWYTVTDFTAGAGGDRIDFTTYLDNLHYNRYATAENIQLIQRGADVVVQNDYDGAGGSIPYADVLLLKNVTLSELTADNFIGFTPSGVTGGGSQEPEIPSKDFSGTSGQDAFEGGTGHDSISGGSGNDTLLGNAGDDRINGDDGNDSLQGDTGADVLSGGAGADSIEGGGGYDQIDGGDGLDYAIVNDLKANRAITQQDGSPTKLSRSGDIDLMTGIERIRFTDATVALDVGADGVAGEVYRLYQAALGRTPDADGVGYWIAAADGGMTLQSIAAEFIQSPEFIALYGASTSNSELVRLLYVNALHRQPDDAGVAFWTDVLDTGAATRTEVLADFSESAENQAAVATIIGNGFEFTPWP